MTILVTGGYGFIGSHLVKELNDKGYKVLIYDLQTYATDYVDFEYGKPQWRVWGDILDVKKLNSVLKTHKIDKIIHLAAESHVDNSIKNPNKFVETNVLGTANILNIAKDKNIPMVHVSTDEVYGTLRSDDKNCTNVKITRCCNNFGINQHIEKLIPKSICSSFNNKEILIYGDGTNKREWIHAQDHAKGVILVMEKGDPGEVYNIGTGEEYSNNQISRMIAKYTKTNAVTRYIDDRLGHDYRYALNYGKIKRLGFKPTRSIKDRKEWNEIIKFYKKYTEAERKVPVRG